MFYINELFYTSYRIFIMSKSAENKCTIHEQVHFYLYMVKYEGISKSFEPNMERARNLDLFCFIFQRSPLPTPHTCPI